MLYKRKQTNKNSLHSWLSCATDGQSSLPCDIQALISDFRPAEETIKFDASCQGEVLRARQDGSLISIDWTEARGLLKNFVTVETCVRWTFVFVWRLRAAVSLNHIAQLMNYSVTVTRVRFQIMLYSCMNSVMKFIHL